MKLSPPERLYLLFHRLNYRRRLRRQVRFKDKYIISVGNLSSGGTGKTPTVALLATKLLSVGRPPLIIMRGYGGSLSKQGALVSDGKKIFCSAAEAGDEALELASEAGLSKAGLSEVGLKVAIGRDRADIIRREGCGSSVILLDDSFQNPSLYCNHHLVLLDAALPPSKMRLYPCGLFREPLEALCRADTVLLTRINQANPDWLKELRAKLEAILGQKALFESRHRPVGIFPAFPASSPTAASSTNVSIEAEAFVKSAASESATLESTALEPAALGEVGAFCGIGQPRAFFSTLRQMGVSIVRQQAFRDHHPYSRRNIENLFSPPKLPWITTAKDLARLKRDNLLTIAEQNSLYILKIEMEILRGKEEQFFLRVLGH